MSESQPMEYLGRYRVRLDDVYLVHARYLDTESPRSEPSAIPPESNVGLALAFDRPSSHSLTVALTVRVELEQPYRVEVAYAGRFSMDPEVPEEEQEELWLQSAAELAPIALYPYVREMVTALSSRGRAESFLLPVLAFQGIQRDRLVVPPPPAEPPEDADAQTAPAAVPPKRPRGRRPRPS